MMKELILGGRRSGKSSHAEKLAQASGRPVTCLVTAHAGDAEMSERIRRHQQRRPVAWNVIEAPVSLAAALKTHDAPERCFLVDCLTLWLSNLLDAPTAADSVLTHERQALLDTLPKLASHVILVSNEVGMGIVPMGELARRFSDEAGRLHQDLALICDRVTWMVAGLPMIVKGKSE